MACELCSKALEHSFKTVNDSVIGVLMDQIEAGSELLVRSREKWMSLFRCRTCGTLWVEACWSSGQMEIYYLYPAPPTDDPGRWLQEEATELKGYLFEPPEEEPEKQE